MVAAIGAAATAGETPVTRLELGSLGVALAPGEGDAFRAGMITVPPTVPAGRRVLAALGPRMLALARDRAAGARVSEHRQAGADHVAVSVVDGGPHDSLPVDQWRRLAEALLG
jgi:hypothetical protein